MNRRQFVATGLAGIGTLTAGCNVLAKSSTSLGEPTVSLEDDGMEKHLTYRHEGTPVAVLSLDQGRHQAAPMDPFPLAIHLAHGDALEAGGSSTTIQRFRFAILVPRGQGRPPAGIYVSPPGGEAWPAMTFETTDEDGWTVVAADGLGGEGRRGTLTVETRVEPMGASIDTVRCQFEATFADGSRQYVVEDDVAFEPAVASGQLDRRQG